MIDYALLHELGVAGWKKRPMFGVLPIKCHSWLYRASCCVILPVYQPLNKPCEQILQGMLKVLSLSAKQLMTVLVMCTNKDQFTDNCQNGLQIIAEMNPAITVILEHEMNLQQTDVMQIFHPVFLFQQPEYKREAYQQLLQVKSRLAKLDGKNTTNENTRCQISASD